MNKKLIPISIAIFLVGMLPPLAFAQTIQRVENNGNLILEDIPPIPESIKSDLVQYQNVRSGAFRGFDQTGKNIFISTHISCDNFKRGYFFIKGIFCLIISKKFGVL